ncbi:hypothetical protein LY90DRAFT_212067 [Neocallimastix californiae]|uniref:Serine protease n=1 Tax=Neocallimastix californiae TaxID=1754190 RepID=A0A1Y1Z5Q1_9FUNG|nr:hypothetical protein LY90DRAFT_212067 [Neocallimastix californiae]|eukprot:ORY05307.1 hypothetical protein LY90DRAFT_212067 [Neocallimastix californiae]
MFGTGFFVKLQYNDIIIYGLMTNNHVINGESQNFEIYFEERKENISIKSNDIKFIFTDEFIDVTFIELKNEVFNRITPYFLTADDRECVITDPIMVIQYPANEPKDKNLQENENIQKLSASIGIIKSISGCNIVHNCSTYFASSGSPLINNSLHVVGIHKSTSGNDNYSTRLSIAKNAIITTYERKRKNEINNTMGIVNELSPENYEELKNHNLVNRKDNKVFILEGNKSILPIHFYRTNYAWFWTNETIPDYEMETLKNLQWTIIIPHEKINKNEKGLSPIYKILIMWLRLSEFMYL